MKVVTHRTDERGVRRTHLVEARPADGGAPVLRTQRYAYPGDEQQVPPIPMVCGNGSTRPGGSGGTASSKNHSQPYI
jgi:hypothetical protein